MVNCSYPSTVAARLTGYSGQNETKQKINLFVHFWIYLNSITNGRDDWLMERDAVCIPEMQFNIQLAERHQSWDNWYFLFMAYMKGNEKEI